MGGMVERPADFPAYRRRQTWKGGAASVDVQFRAGGRGQGAARAEPPRPPPAWLGW
jgi:hypothetical protein